MFSVVLPAAGPTLVNGEPATERRRLRAPGQGRVHRDPHVRAVINADGAVPHRRVIHTLDLLKTAGIAKVAFGALPPGRRACRDAEQVNVRVARLRRPIVDVVLGVHAPRARSARGDGGGCSSGHVRPARDRDRPRRARSRTVPGGGSHTDPARVGGGAACRAVTGCTAAGTACDPAASPAARASRVETFRNSAIPGGGRRRAGTQAQRTGRPHQRDVRDRNGEDVRGRRDSANRHDHQPVEGSEVGARPAPRGHVSRGPIHPGRPRRSELVMPVADRRRCAADRRAGGRHPGRRAIRRNRRIGGAGLRPGTRLRSSRGGVRAADALRAGACRERRSRARHVSAHQGPLHAVSALSSGRHGRQ